MMRKWQAALAFAGLLLIAGCGNDDTQEAEKNTETPGVEGVWEGAIEVPGQPIPIILEFSSDSGTLSIPAQGIADYPLSTFKFDDPELAFDVDIQGQRLVFEGQVATEKIAGTFTQQGQTFPFELVPGTKPQPIDPEKIVELERGDETMQGLEEIPAGSGPHPVALIIAGSGPTDKDGNSLTLPGKNDSLKMLAEELAQEGIATLRYDKRGIGDNTALGKSEVDLRFEDYVEDAAAWIRSLQQDERFSDVTVIGHSEGALIGLVAANTESVDSYVSLTGVGRTADELLKEQLGSSLPPEQFEEAEAILEQLAQGETVETVSPELQQVFRPSIQPYLQSWIDYDPLEQVAKLDAPALFVGGTHDLQVPVSDAELLQEAKPQNSELLIIDGMNHVLKSVPDDQEANMAAYSDPELPLADGLVEGIIAFLKD